MRAGDRAAVAFGEGCRTALTDEALDGCRLQMTAQCCATTQSINRRTVASGGPVTVVVLLRSYTVFDRVVLSAGHCRPTDRHTYGWLSGAVLRFGKRLGLGG